MEGLLARQLLHFGKMDNQISNQFLIHLVMMTTN